jgi:hypothetical protein
MSTLHSLSFFTIKFVSTIFVPITMGSCAAKAKCLSLSLFFFRFHLNLRPLLCLLNFMKIHTDGQNNFNRNSGRMPKVLRSAYFRSMSFCRLWPFFVYFASIQTSETQLLYYIPTGLTYKNFTLFPHDVFTCSTWIPEQTAIIFFYCRDGLIFITETFSVYCANVPDISM